MNELTDKTRAIKKKKLIIWGVRQVLSAGLVFYVVNRWPNMTWLIPVWLLVAAASLIALLVMFRKIEDKMSDLDSKLEELDVNIKM
jgi:O-antigen/teichoic acid export membrane protein